LNQRVTEWNATLATFDIPDRYRTIGSLLATSIVFSVNPVVVRIIAGPLAKSFGLSGDDYHFLINQYLPKIIEASKSMDKTTKKMILKDAVASFAKFGYAFLWFSDAGTKASQGIFGSVLNFFGSYILPVFNFKANILNSYDYQIQNFQYGKNLYPGDKRCNKAYPHTKWHVQSAIAIVDAVKLANDLCTATNSN